MLHLVVNIRFLGIIRIEWRISRIPLCLHQKFTGQEETRELQQKGIADTNERRGERVKRECDGITIITINNEIDQMEIQLEQ